MKIVKFLFSRMVVVGLMIAIQAAILILAIWKLSSYFVYLYALFESISLAVILWILNKKENPSYKLAWTIPILLFPVFGGLLYLVFGLNRTTKKYVRKMEKIYELTRPLISQDTAVAAELAELDRSIANQSNYLTNYSHYPLWKNSTAEYLSPGEVKFARLKEELLKARHYIFLEYFIIEEGKMWNGILDILKQKVAEGLDVRVIYDDIGSLNTIPYDYCDRLNAMGIRCQVFNPFKPFLSVVLNNRDHRKIAVIDGHTAFTGGINLADEYINAYEKHGHWKDASVLIRGEAVWNFTMMFLRIWNFNKLEDKDFEQYRPHVYHPEPFESDGFIQPYGDSPFDDETVGENVYINMILKAKDYVYINTPYLIVDNELVTALSLAAKSGVDVRIVTPHIGDKWYVHMMTRAYYKQLIEAKVKIYEYTPGFIHSKTFVADDELAIIGTINLDYRSLYLHLECGAWIYKNRAVGQLKDDFLQTLEQCQPITLEDCRKVPLWNRVMRALLRIFAPLM